MQNGNNARALSLIMSKLLRRSARALVIYACACARPASTVIASRHVIPRRIYGLLTPFPTTDEIIPCDKHRVDIFVENYLNKYLYYRTTHLSRWDTQ